MPLGGELRKCGTVHRDIAGGLGIDADLRALPKTDDCIRSDVQLFSESNSRFVVEVEPDKFDAFAKLMLNLPFGQIGKVTVDLKLKIHSAEGREIINSELKVLKEAWQKTFHQFRSCAL